MKQLLLVGVGGFMGSIIRYGISCFPLGNGHFPLSTLFVNLVGSFVMGIALSITTLKVQNPIYYFFIPGLLGGFTTYSAFSGDILSLYFKGEIFLALSYVLCSITGGIFLVYIGYKLGEHLIF